MVKSLITLVLSALRWALWLIQYAVVYPLAMMAMLVVLVFWKGPYTPGQALVNIVESVQREGYVIYDCTPPVQRGDINGDEKKPLLPPPPVLKEDCTTVSTDSSGYAAHIDRIYTKNILWLWLMMAVVFTGGAVLFGLTPARKIGVTWVRDAKENVYNECRPDKGAIYWMRKDIADKFLRNKKTNNLFRKYLKK